MFMVRFARKGEECLGYFAGVRMENVSPLRVVAPLLLLLSTTTGCRKADGPAQWDVDLLGPVLNTTFTIADLVADSDLEVGPDGLITIVYTGELFGVDLDTLFQVPDTSFTYDYALPFGTATLIAGTQLPPIDEVATLDVDEVQLRLLELREGTLHLSLVNKIQSGVIGTFTLPGATHAGNTVSMSQFVPAGSVGSPTMATAVRDMAFHRFDLTGPTYDAVNTLATQLLLQLDPNGSGATITNADTIKAIATYSGLKPQYARGYFGQRTVHFGPDVSDFGLFGNIVGGALDIDQVEVNLKVTSGFGVDARVTMDHITAINSGTGATLDLQHTIVPGPININRAVDHGNGFSSSEYQNQLDNSDSNIDQLLEVLPDRIEYELDLEVNPLGDISNGNDFLYWNSDLQAQLELRLPLTIIASELTLQQFSVPDLPGTAESHAIQFGELKLFAVNGFPFSADLLLDIVDADGTVLANLPVGGAIASGILGTDLHVQTPVSSQLSTYLTTDLVNLLYTPGARIRSIVVFNTADQTQHLDILDSYQLDLRMVFDGNYVINGNE